MVNMFGRNYEEIGDSKKGLILKNSGKIKIQWGNTFLDLINSNGQINVNQNIIKQITSESQIKTDGFYLLNNNLLAKIKDNIIIISSEENSSYISFKVAQKLDSENKLIALQNLGLIYESQDESNIYPNQGFVYFLDSQKFYNSYNGTLNEIDFVPDVINKNIAYNGSKIDLNSELSFVINDNEIFKIAEDGIYIFGIKYYSTSGNTSGTGGSNSETGGNGTTNSSKSEKFLKPIDVYSGKNIITQIIPEENENACQLTFKYPHIYKEGNKIRIYSNQLSFIDVIVNNIIEGDDYNIKVNDKVIGSVITSSNVICELVESGSGNLTLPYYINEQVQHLEQHYNDENYKNVIPTIDIVKTITQETRTQIEEILNSINRINLKLEELDRRVTALENENNN